MSLYITNYVTIVRKYGLRNIVRKIWMGGVFFSLIHAAFYWYATYKIGAWGEKMAALERAFANRDSIWKGVSAVLGFPLGVIESEGWGGFGFLVLNSILWGLVLSLLVVPAFVKRVD